MVDASVALGVHVLEEPITRRSTLEEGELMEITNGKTTRAVSELEPEVKDELIACLKRNLDIFAKDVYDLTGIDLALAEHHLNISKGTRLVKQKK